MSALVEGGDDLRVGTTVSGRYFVHRLLALGGTGRVYEATRTDDDRPVALKLLAAADGDRLRRWEREAAIASRLRHADCVQPLDAGPDGHGGYFIAMELVRGRDLARVLQEEGPLPILRAARIAARVLSVLAEAHGAGVIHRDLKPANIMVVASPEGAEGVKVLDFGIATLIEAEAETGQARPTHEGIAHGTPAYMSPEQIRGEPLDPRSDLYAVGALLFELLAGRAPFEGASPMAVAARQLTEAAPGLAERRPDAPPPLVALVARALERDRGRRPASADAMRQELARATEGVREPAPLPRRMLPPTETFAVDAVAPTTARRRPFTAVALALLAGVAAVAVAGALRARSSMGEPLGPAPSTEATAEVTHAAAPTVAGASAAAGSGLTPASAGTAAAPLAAAKGEGARPAVKAAAQRPVAPPPPSRPAIRLVRGELNTVPTPPASTGDGILILQATPWAVVAIGEEPLGETPREVRIAAGVHRVRATHPDLGTREDRVVVTAGERTLWTARFGE